ncbi:hypothetical protein SAMN04487912_105286 [Arthrobacter sp. cf158]|uniref:GAF domain-containing protein n=1 Tax=Arthrobacter sp. cf158 TaxID=1761744 RepID=UPI00089814C3|nr:hypothetical protein SAMN04487912_105286 [Arthrobacter sp. cf158]
MTIAGNSDEAILLDGVEQALGYGPCLESLETLQPVLLADTHTDTRWPAYAGTLAAAGARSVLGLPLDLGKDASAALKFFAPATGLFTEEAIGEAVVFGDMAGQALRLACVSLPPTCSRKTSRPRWSSGRRSIWHAE